MRLSITDKFLWDIYSATSKVGDVLDFITKPPTMANYLSGPRNPVFEKYGKEVGKKAFAKLIYYLKTRNYIRVKNLEGKKAIILTKEGVGRVLKASFVVEGRNKRKDKKWIMLIFDVPEKYRKSRDLLRSILHNLGYKMFQKSVWITPYDVSEKTEKLLQYHSLDNFVKIFLIEEI